MIIVHHHVAPLSSMPEGTVTQRENGWAFNTPPSVFDDNLTYLKELGYQFLPYSQLIDRVLSHGVKYEDRLVALSFDDGWLDNFEYAYPILKRHSLSAIFFLTTGQFAAHHSQYRLTADQVREMTSHGMEIGSHPRTHSNLCTLSTSSVEREVCGSAEDLMNHFNQPARHLAYPGGAFDRRTIEIVKRAGYQSAASVIGSYDLRDCRYWMHRIGFQGSLRSTGNRVRLTQVGALFKSIQARRQLRRYLSCA